MMDYVIIWSGWALIATGFIGCFLPVLPGSPIACAALFLALSRGDHSSPTMTCLIAASAVTAIVTVLDFVVPAQWERKKIRLLARRFRWMLRRHGNRALFPPSGRCRGSFPRCVRRRIARRQARGQIVEMLLRRSHRFPVRNFPETRLLRIPCILLLVGYLTPSRSKRMTRLFPID